MRNILLLLTIVFLLGSCKQDASTTTKSLDSEATENLSNGTDQKSNIQSATEILTEAALIPKPTTAITNKEFIPAFVEYIESTYCASKNETGVKCISMHETSVKSDFMAKHPITLNFPYDGTFDWSGLVDKKGFSNYWSDKCGFMNEETNEVITYYCLNLSGSTKPWLDSLSSTNQFISDFNSYYTKSQSITPDYQTTFILNNLSSLDYENMDHRAFYWMYHLALYEESRAATLTKAWQNQ